MTCRPLPLLLLSALPACGLEFSEPLANTVAMFQVSVGLIDSAPAGEARLSGSLWPGYDARGSVRTLPDSSFAVVGRTITPHPGYTTDARPDIRYSDTWLFHPDAAPGSVEVRAPRIPGIGEAAPTLRLTPPWRAGPANVTVSPGSPLKLDLVTAPAPADSVFEIWTVHVVKDGRLVAQLGAIGAVPPTVEVPWALLTGIAGEGRAVLMVDQSVITPQAQGRRYVATLLVSTRHVWSVSVQP